MKRCPECKRDYFDDSLLYCLDEGTALLGGPSHVGEPLTAIFRDARGVKESRLASIGISRDAGVFPSGSLDWNRAIDAVNAGAISTRRQLVGKDFENRAVRGEIIGRLF